MVGGGKCGAHVQADVRAGDVGEVKVGTMVGEVGGGNIWTLKVGGGGIGQQERQVPFRKIGPGNVPFGIISPRQVKEGCGAGKMRSKSCPSGTPPIPATRADMDPPCFVKF